MRLPVTHIVRSGVCLALGVILILSGLGKILHPFEFLGIVYDYRIVTQGTALWVAFFLPWVEVTLGLCVILRIHLRMALAGIIALFACFTIAIASVLSRGMIINCGCYVLGNDTDSISVATLIRTAALTLIAFSCFFMTRQRPKEPEALTVPS